jgi:hypothetical protein
MIWNMQRYLELKFPNEIIFANIRYKQFPEDACPDRNVLIIETTGTEGALFKYKQMFLQFISRDIDAVKARSLAELFYNELHGRFGLHLPAVNVGGVVYPEIETGQISSQSTPQSIGEDEGGRPEFSFTMKILYI